MKRVLLIRYGELHLKGLNRPYFERTLLNHISHVIKNIPGATLWKGQGRFYVGGYSVHQETDLLSGLQNIFGIHSICPAWAVDKKIEIISKAAVDILAEAGYTTGSFRLECRRSDKSFPLESIPLSRKLGSVVLDAYPSMTVDLHNPEHTLFCEIREEAYLYTRIVPGAGGMPVGTAGKVMLLLSGGIDSPVAGWLLGKRGVSLEAVYFHSPPHTSQRALDKVLDLAELVSRWTGPIRLHVVPFTATQELLYEKGSENMLTLLMRRSMMRIASRLAEANGCDALATGENLGQVASQTLQALAVTNEVADRPILRPLITYDKIETVELARRIGTYETSILPYQDCCTVFIPKHPLTKPKRKNVQKEEQKLLDELLRLELLAAETEDIYNVPASSTC
ncbi:MAG: tRNA uracil 4-sulfurtransferase ThiI [Christensenellales bacterium]|jgi:thiamine biosynthesis protein ThiI